MLTPIDTVNTPIPEQYQSLFNGLGTFTKSYEIKLKQDAQPLDLEVSHSLWEKSGRGASKDGIP